MSEKEIKKQIRNSKVKDKIKKILPSLIVFSVGTAFGKVCPSLFNGTMNMIDYATLEILSFLGASAMYVIMNSHLGDEELEKSKDDKEDGYEEIEKIEEKFYERLKKGKYKILLNEDGEIKFQKHETEEKVEPKKHETEEKVESKKHEVEEKVEPKKESILSELAWEYVSYNYGGTGLSKEELTNLKNDLLEKLNVLMNENNPEKVESQLTNKEEVKVKKYTCNDIKE